MAISGNKEVIDFFQGFGKALGNMGKVKVLSPTHKVIMNHYGMAIIPLLSIDDGGKSRGVFVGLLRKLGIRVPDAVWRDKSLLSGMSGDIRASAFADGLREGLQTSLEGLNVKLNLRITQVNVQKAILRLRDKKLLSAEVTKMIRKELMHK